MLICGDRIQNVTAKRGLVHGIEGGWTLYKQRQMGYNLMYMTDSAGRRYRFKIYGGNILGEIHHVEKLTDNRFVNLYNVDATSVHNTPVSYYVASPAKSVEELKLKTGKNTPDGVIIYSIYGEKRDKVVLIRQYRYALGRIYL